MAEPGAVKAVHAGTAVRQDLDQAFAFEQLQRLAHGLDADAQTVGDRLHAHPASRFDIAIEDLLPEAVGDAAVSGQRFGWRLVDDLERGDKHGSLTTKSYTILTGLIGTASVACVQGMKTDLGRVGAWRAHKRR